MAETSVCIGSETDDALSRRLNAALKSLGWRRLNSWWGFGGSQEVVRQRYRQGDSVLNVETETYVGITVSGPQWAVEAVVDQLGD
jgi:hypothetical protein